MVSTSSRLALQRTAKAAAWAIGIPVVVETTNAVAPSVTPNPLIVIGRKKHTDRREGKIMDFSMPISIPRDRPRQYHIIAEVMMNETVIGRAEKIILFLSACL